ncbi:oxidoreductase (plasmid) [Microvirga lotononidis]|uniref:Short-chain alcohol dehydrogenase n=1 Tax=Microvirga lotononidis TaxID=864069 RepID=I4Z1U9_9HYPH|nr:oxidoreductase [Microvirga lotononidis]EIM30191.1 short-chain alcohol dehydrogenase [Microvirga lotononidis]WQO31584.1 oxidoreductase [Microvirga lotononidis]
MDKSSKPVALVTGASSGMGKDIARRLITEGYTVYGAARRVERMADLQAAGAMAVALDVTDDASAVAAIDRILREQSRIDVLINAAGYGQYGALEDVPIAEGRRQIETNLIGLARIVQLCLPHMRSRGSGKIVNISSIGGKFALPLGGWYHASKFALEGYSDALRHEVRQFGIDVIVIEPGGIASEWEGIAREEAERHSGHGAYADMVAKLRKMQGRKAPPPSLVSDLVVRALKARRPAVRYSRGLMSAPYSSCGAIYRTGYLTAW